MSLEIKLLLFNLLCYKKTVSNKNKLNNLKIKLFILNKFLIFLHLIIYFSFECFIRKSAKYLIGFSGLSLATSAIP
jgi:DMSO/TMAO reductase YedYZ heme-binding membrane subunit